MATYDLTNNPATITAPINTAGTAVYGAAGTTWTVTNQSTIEGTGAGGIGIDLAGSGTIINAGASYVIYGGSAGVVLGSSGLVANAGTIGGASIGIDLAAGGGIINSAGGLISGGSYGVEIAGGPGTVTNGGTIEDFALSTHRAVYFASGGTLDNLSGGLISGDTGVFAASGSTTIDNSGTISGGSYGINLNAGGTVTNSGSAALIAGGGTAIRINGPAGGTVSNTGTILGGNGAGGIGIDLVTGGSIDNGSSIGNGRSATIAGYAGGIRADTGTTTITNYGTIAGTGAFGGGYGVEFYESGEITNGSTSDTKALITGYEYGLRLGVSPTSPPPPPGTVTNYGTIAASATFGYGIKFKDGGNVRNGAAATIAGSTDGIYDAGYGFFDVSGTIANYGAIFGGYNADNRGVWLTGLGLVTNGASNSTAAVISGYQGVYLASGTVTNFGTIVGIGGTGVDLPAGGTVIDGGTIIGVGTAVYFGGGGGGNRLVLDPGYVLSGAVVVTGAGNTLELGSGGSTGVLSAGIAGFPNFDSILVDGGANWTLSGSNTIGSGVTLTISGTLLDTGTLVNAGKIYAGNGTLIIDPATFVNSGYVSGTATLAGGGYLGNSTTGTITAGGIAVYGKTSPNTIVNAGTIDATGLAGAGIELKAGGFVSNAATGLIEGAPFGVAAYGQSISVGNFGTIAGGASGDGVFLSAGGTLTNGGTAAGGNTALIVGDFGVNAHGAATLANYGTIAGTGGYGVELVAHASFGNYGLVTGGSAGIDFRGGGTLTNGGTASATGAGVHLVDGGLVSNTSNGYISGGAVGVLAEIVAATVVNDGTITGGSYGIELGVPGSIHNDGLVSGPTGIYVHDGVGTLTNGGTINGGAGGTGVDFASGGMISNTGTITGYYGVALGSGGIVVNAGTISGGASGYGAGVFLADGGSVSNTSGLIEGYDGVIISPPRFGTAAGTVINGGTIIGSPAGYGVGMETGYVGNQLAGTIGGHIGVFIDSAGTVTNFGTISASSFFPDGAGILLANGGTVTNSGGLIEGYNGVLISPIVGTVIGAVINTGTIVGDQGPGVYLYRGYIGNSGGTIAGYFGVEIDSAGTVANSGTIFGSGLFGAYLRAGGMVSNSTGGLIQGFIGVDVAGPPFGSSSVGTGTVTNGGTIHGVIEGVLLGAGYVDNQTGGTITGYGAGVAIKRAGTVVNDGTIIGRDFGVFFLSAGTVTNGGIGNRTALIAGANGSAGAYNSSGTGYPGVYGGFGLVLSGGGTVTNFAVISAGQGGSGGSGTTTGGTGGSGGYGVLLLGGGAVYNTGTIAGALGGAGGNGPISGVAGTAGDGIMLLAGGIVDNGSAGAATALIVGRIGVYANGSSTATVTNYGTIASLYGNGGTAVSFGGATDVLVVEAGSTLVGKAIGGGGTLDFAAGGGPGTVAGIGAPGGEYSGFVQYAVLSGATWTLSGGNTIGNGATLGDFGTLIVAGGSTLVNAGLIEAASGTLVVDGPVPAGGTLINNGSIAGTVTLVGAAYLDNTSGGRMTASDDAISASGSASVSNAGYIGGGFQGVVMDAGGAVTNHSGGKILGEIYGVQVGNTPATVTNAGTIAGTSGAGVDLFDGGTVVNQSGGVISGPTGFNAAVLTVDGAAYIGNDGRIDGAIGIILQAGGTVVNHSGGSISAAGLGIAATRMPITVSNAGAISGGGYGIYASGGGLVTNQRGGTIVGTASGTRAGVGIVIVSGGTVVDAGTIVGAGGTAISLAGTGADLLVLDPGYVLSGKAVAHGTSNTLELGSGGSAGTLTGLGTNFTGFATVTVDTGANWVLSGSNTIGSGVTVTDLGTLTDAGTLTNAGTIVATSGQLIVDPATLINSDLVSGTVTLGGSSYLDNTTGGTITAAGNAVYGAASLNTVVNSGLIVGTAGAGVLFNAGGYVRNTGTISGGAAGVRILAGGYVSNGNGGRIAGGVGVFLGAGGTIVDSGTIVGSAGVAVQFVGNGADLLVLEHGYKLAGTVSGSTTAGATNTLELAGAPGNGVTVNYDTLGLSNFQEVLFGPGGAATLDVSNTTGTLPVTIAGFTATTDAIDLTAIGTNGTIVSIDTVANTVTVSGSLGTVVLQFDNSDSGILGKLTTWSDGAGGTDLELPPSPDDFAGDGSSDVVWQYEDSANPADPLNGDTAVWLMNGTTEVSGPLVAVPGANWHVVGTGDFGNAQADLVWQYENSTSPTDPLNGDTSIWLMNGTTEVSGPLIAIPGANWHVVATGDFGNDQSDIVWQYENNTDAADPLDGNTAIWMLDGTSPISGPLVATPGAGWHVVGTGNFGNDQDDIVWQYDNSGNALDPANGETAIWLMNGTTPTAKVVIGNSGAGWHVVGTGYFGNGQSDLLWQYDNSGNASDPYNGETAIWMMNGTTPTAKVVVGNSGAGWHAIATGDFTGSGQSDILWQYENSGSPADPNNGTAAIWLMNGTTPTAETVIGAPPASWHVVT